ncbi:cytosine deaminase [Parahypoxylon ruwenzoriense]
MDDTKGLALAIEEAKAGYREGGVPIGAALFAADGRVLGRGRNMRVQKGNPILHGETSCLQNAGRLPSSAYRGSTMYTTLSPCDMCKSLARSTLQDVKNPYGYTTVRTYIMGITSLKPKPSATARKGTGACLLYGIARVVVGENRTFLGGESYLKARGVEVVVADSPECKELMDKFIAEKPDIWNEDIGVEERVYSREGIEAPSGPLSVGGPTQYLEQEATEGHGLLAGCVCGIIHKIKRTSLLCSTRARDLFICEDYWGYFIYS